MINCTSWTHKRLLLVIYKMLSYLRHVGNNSTSLLFAGERIFAPCGTHQLKSWQTPRGQIQHTCSFFACVVTLNTTTPPTKNTPLQISKSMLNNSSTWQETMLNALADVQAKGGESRGWWLQHVHSCKFHGGSWQHVRDFVHVEFLQGSWTVHAPWLEGACKVHEPAFYTWNAPTLKNAIFQNVFKIEFELISRELAYQIKEIKKKRTCSSVKNNSSQIRVWHVKLFNVLPLSQRGAIVQNNFTIEITLERRFWAGESKFFVRHLYVLRKRFNFERSFNLMTLTFNLTRWTCYKY